MIWLLLPASFALTLDEARERAVSEALTVEVARAERDAARRNTAARVGDALPSLTAYASAGTGAGQTAFGFERPVSSLYAAGVRGTWTLVAPSTWAAAGAARRTSLGQQALLDWAEVQARESATASYAEAWGALQVVEALESSRDDAQRGFDATAARTEAGLATEADVARARAELAAVEARLAQARGQVVSTCAALQSLLGDDIDGACSLSEPTWEAPGEGPEYHPALVASKEALAASRGKRTAAWLTLAPAVTLTGQVAEYKAGEGDWGLGWQASAQVDLPLFDGGTTIAEGRVLDADVIAAQHALDARQRDLVVARVAADAEYQAARDALTAQSRALDAAQLAYAQVDARVQQGLSGLDAWLDAREALEDARVSYASANAAVGAALAAVEAARGVR